jgi:GTP-binding protein
VGRSNVGKSSLLNALLGRKGLARVSATPGKTQLMNVFRLPACYLVDLPGYGWARASHAERVTFRKLLQGYLTGRERLAGVVWLLDVRHPPSTDDRDMQDLLIQAGRPTLAVLTKGDKLPRGQRLKALRDRGRELGLLPGDLLLTSSTTGEGLDDLAESLLATLA